MVRTTTTLGEGGQIADPSGDKSAAIRDDPRDGVYAPPAGLTIVAKGQGWVAVDKPTGLLSVPGRTDDKSDCVRTRIEALFPGSTGPIVMHRLDMDTSGVMVCALDEHTHRAVSVQFQHRLTRKVYVALVDGRVEIESGTIDLPVRPEPGKEPVQVIDREHRRPAVTAWKVLGYEHGTTRLQLLPMTGRTHQLRVHCAWAGSGGLRGRLGSAGGLVRGHPILGDVLYGPPVIDPWAAPRLMLHACELEFTDPRTERRVTVRAPKPF